MKGSIMKFMVLRWALIISFLFTGTSFSQDTSITGDNLKVERSKRKEYESEFKSAKTVFTVGSALAAAGFTTFLVSGNNEMVLPLGSTLFFMGHTGLIMTGVSISKMKRIVIEANGKDEFSWAPTSGWALYGGGWAAIAAGIPVMAIGINNEVSPMVIAGIAGMGVGEVLHILSLVKFNQQRRYWNRNFNQISFSPGLFFDENRNCLLGLNFKCNY